MQTWGLMGKEREPAGRHVGENECEGRIMARVYDDVMMKLSALYTDLNQQ